MDSTETGSGSTAPAGRSVGRAFALYTGLRALLFAVVLCLLLVLGLRGIPALAAALLVSSIASLFVLRGPRDAATGALAERQDRRAAEQARLRGMLDG